MTDLQAFLNAIPAAASSPLALVAYLAAIGSWTVIAWRVKRFKLLMARLPDFPLEDRRAVVEAEIGRIPLRAGLTPEQYLRSRIHLYFLLGFIAVLATIVIVLAMAGFRSADTQARSDGLTDLALGSPPSNYQSAFNVLANGAGAVDGAAAQLRISSDDDIEDEVTRLARQGLRSEAITQRLAANSGAGRFKQVNGRLTEAAKTVDERFTELSKCYHIGECRNGERAPELCRHLRAIQRNVKAINGHAKQGRGVMLNSSGGPPIIGGGALDIEFDLIQTPNVDFLASTVCN